jgi:hypothetical protein
MFKRLGIGFLVVMTAACAGALVGTAISPSTETPATASPQALAHFERMARAADSSGLEQAACVSEWTFKLREGKLRLHVDRVRAAEIERAHPDSVRFLCFQSEGTVHTHALVCRPSAVDLVGNEMFGVVVCPRPTRFAVFAVRPMP